MTVDTGIPIQCFECGTTDADRFLRVTEPPDLAGLWLCGGCLEKRGITWEPERLPRLVLSVPGEELARVAATSSRLYGVAAVELTFTADGALVGDVLDPISARDLRAQYGEPHVIEMPRVPPKLEPEIGPRNRHERRKERARVRRAR